MRPRPPSSTSTTFGDDLLFRRHLSEPLASLHGGGRRLPGWCGFTAAVSLATASIPIYAAASWRKGRGYVAQLPVGDMASSRTRYEKESAAPPRNGGSSTGRVRCIGCSRTSLLCGAPSNVTPSVIRGIDAITNLQASPCEGALKRVTHGARLSQRVAPAALADSDAQGRKLISVEGGQPGDLRASRRQSRVCRATGGFPPSNRRRLLPAMFSRQHLKSGASPMCRC